MNTQPEGSWEIPIQDKVEELLQLATDDGRGSVFDGWFDAQPPLVQVRGAAYLWFESWVGAAQPLINTDPDRLGVFVAHELFHAIRFTVAPLKPMMEDATRRISGPREFSLAALGTDPRDRMFEEGLATLFSLAAFPERADADALSLSPSDLEWLRPRWEATLGRHEPLWSGAQIDRREESLTRAFRKSASTNEPTIDQPPTTWAYYAGLELARRRVTGDWSRDVSATRL